MIWYIIMVKWWLETKYKLEAIGDICGTKWQLAIICMRVMGIYKTA
jgi:hypothetical protein